MINVEKIKKFVSLFFSESKYKIKTELLVTFFTVAFLSGSIIVIGSVSFMLGYFVTYMMDVNAKVTFGGMIWVGFCSLFCLFCFTMLVLNVVDIVKEFCAFVRKIWYQAESSLLDDSLNKIKDIKNG